MFFPNPLKYVYRHKKNANFFFRGNKNSCCFYITSTTSKCCINYLLFSRENITSSTVLETLSSMYWVSTLKIYKNHLKNFVVRNSFGHVFFLVKTSKWWRWSWTHLRDEIMFNEEILWYHWNMNMTTINENSCVLNFYLKNCLYFTIKFLYKHYTLSLKCNFMDTSCMPLPSTYLLKTWCL